MKPRELEMHIQDFFDGCIGEGEFVALQQELYDNPQARDTYREYLHLHHALRFRSKGVDLLRVVPMDKVNERRQKRAFKQAVMVAAAVLLLGAVIMALFNARERQPTLTFNTSRGSDLSISHQLTGEDLPSGQTLEPGSRLILRHGVVELEFKSGVRSVVRAPADLTLLREDLVDLKKGTAWFEVPKKAVGFQVRTPDLVLTDLGTEFGIISKPDVSDEVHVFHGKVEVLNRRGVKNVATLTKGIARIAEPAGRWHDTSMNRSAFLDELPKSVPSIVSVDDFVAFTSSPNNEMIGRPSYTFTAEKALSGFDASKADKLVVTLSYELRGSGYVHDVTYGGVRMDLAVRSNNSQQIQTAIYYLDSPGASGDLVVNMRGKANGIGGSVVALSGAASGGPATTDMVAGRSIQLADGVENSVAIVAHACNDNRPDVSIPLDSSVKKLFSGPTGSSMGAAAYLKTDSPDPVTVNFPTKG
ncbi:MAG: FecR family protein, partial [Verrucomicrobiae bacterium]|nr:FecR family protein [Verrucomicrobiae bacterium]NNJ87718.1 FecR domain-containing protein [Akkermansiaceae bacterium]